MELIRSEVEDDVDIVAGEDVFWVCGGERDIELGRAVVGVLVLLVAGDVFLLSFPYLF